jgi:hypothetical protein
VDGKADGLARGKAFGAGDLNLAVGVRQGQGDLMPVTAFKLAAQDAGGQVGGFNGGGRQGAMGQQDALRLWDRGGKGPCGPGMRQPSGLRVTGSRQPSRRKAATSGVAG